MPDQQPVLYHVQVLRLIAASSILLSHAVKMFGAHLPHFWTIPWAAGVDIFFVISGFIMTWLTLDRFGTPGASRGFLARRVVRIVPPYWFFTLLLVAVLPIVNADMRDKTVNATWLAASLGFIPWPRDNGKLNPVLAQGWTLNYEAFFYVAFGLALMWRRGIAALCVGLLVLVACHPWIPASWYPVKFWSDPIVLCFVAGIALALLRARGARLNLPARIIVIVAGALVYLRLPQPYNVLVASGLIAAAFILAEQPERLGPVARFLQYGGDASYTIYLSHTIVIGLIVAAWGSGGSHWLWLGVGIGTLASYAFAFGFYRWAEVPVTRWLRRRFT